MISLPMTRALAKVAVATVLFIPAIAAAVIGYRTQRRMERRLRPPEPVTSAQRNARAPTRKPVKNGVSERLTTRGGG